MQSNVTAMVVVPGAKNLRQLDADVPGERRFSAYRLVEHARQSAALGRQAIAVLFNERRNRERVEQTVKPPVPGLQ